MIIIIIVILIVINSYIIIKDNDNDNDDENNAQNKDNRDMSLIYGTSTILFALKIFPFQPGLLL